MGEAGLSPTEVGKEIAEHAKHSGHGERNRAIAITESLLLAVVALLAAWSGYAAAKWSTESRLALAQASTARIEASQAYMDAQESKNFDASTFNAWFEAFTAKDEKAQDLARRRFRPEYAKAFDAWIATDPENNRSAPSGPRDMEEYVLDDEVKGDVLTAKADRLYAEGAKAGETADDYVRTTVLLASVLFIVGISSQVQVNAARYILITVAGAVMIYGAILIILAPKPPG